MKNENSLLLLCPPRVCWGVCVYTCMHKCDVCVWTYIYMSWLSEEVRGKVGSHNCVFEAGALISTVLRSLGWLTLELLVQSPVSASRLAVGVLGL